jgi:hypothetical protein
VTAVARGLVLLRGVRVRELMHFARDTNFDGTIACSTKGAVGVLWGCLPKGGPMWARGGPAGRACYRLQPHERPYDLQLWHLPDSERTAAHHLHVECWVLQRALRNVAAPLPPSTPNGGDSSTGLGGICRHGDGGYVHLAVGQLSGAWRPWDCSGRCWSRSVSVPVVPISAPPTLERA